jgi:hypothetical protein
MNLNRNHETHELHEKEIANRFRRTAEGNFVMATTRRVRLAIIGSCRQSHRHPGISFVSFVCSRFRIGHLEWLHHSRRARSCGVLSGNGDEMKERVDRRNPRVR